MNQTTINIQNKIIQELSKNIKNSELKYFVQSFGCQMNSHDTENIEGILQEIGYSKTTDYRKADFILYNTCCVRENAEQRVYGQLGHLKARKRKNPNLIIAICGCMMQQEHVIKELQKNNKHVDIIFGTFNLYKLPELIQTHLETKETVIDIWKQHHELINDLPRARTDHFRASVNIVYGCNNYCTYCIVPYVRGRERSRKVVDILDEIKYLVDDGVTEVTLLGQNVNSYGKTLNKPISFADLLRKVNKINGLKRIKFMTSHPKDLSDDLIDAMAECDKVSKHIHLPIQSGSSKILKAMGRVYTKESYLKVVKKLKSKIPGVAITTDIIVGFPGETEEDFLDTIDIINKVMFEGVYTFIYSKRTGTPAATMKNQIDKEIITNRFNRLLKTVDNVAANQMAKYQNKSLEVLVESKSKHGADTYNGRSEYGTLVHFKGSASMIGTYVSVLINETQPYYIKGEIE